MSPLDRVYREIAVLKKVIFYTKIQYQSEQIIFNFPCDFIYTTAGPSKCRKIN